MPWTKMTLHDISILMLTAVCKVSLFGEIASFFAEIFRAKGTVSFTYL